MINIEKRTLISKLLEKGLFDGNFHDCEVLPFHIIHKSLGENFLFYSNLQVNKKLIKNFPTYYRQIINTWKSKFSCQHW